MVREELEQLSTDQSLFGGRISAARSASERSTDREPRGRHTCLGVLPLLGWHSAAGETGRPSLIGETSRLKKLADRRPSAEQLVTKLTDRLLANPDQLY